MSDIESMRHLWRRVLVQAVRDALGTDDVKDSELRVARQKARVWLNGRSEDFSHVCTLAGYDPEMVRDWWRRMKDNDDEMAAASARIYSISTNGRDANMEVM